MPTGVSRAAYADMFGPTTGDKVRYGPRPRVERFLR
jgi:urease alpha subunit